MEHQDGAFDSQTLTPMLTFMTADTYCDYMAQTILPGQQLEFCSQEEITREMQNLMDTKADELYQQSCQLFQGTGYNVDGAYVGAAQREYRVSLNGYPFKFIILSVTEGTQLSYSEEFAYNMGTVNQTMIAWDSPGCYFMLTPEEECEANKDIFNQFGSNTIVSDQFTKALANVRNQIIQAGSQNYSSMSDITGECQSSMSSSMGSEDTYTTTDQFSDYIFDQNDYTLSNGDHIKVPSSYDYVYEGTDGNVYVSDSSFDQPGRLYSAGSNLISGILGTEPDSSKKIIKGGLPDMKKMNKKYLISAVLTVSLLFGSTVVAHAEIKLGELGEEANQIAAPSTAASNSSDVIALDDLGISVIPSEYVAIQQEDGFVYIYNQEKDCIPYVIVGYYDMAADDFASQFTQYMRESYEDLQVTSPEAAVTLGNREYTYIQYSYSVSGYAVRDSRLFFTENGRTYMFGAKEIPELSLYVGSNLEKNCRKLCLSGRRGR